MYNTVFCTQKIKNKKKNWEHPSALTELNSLSPFKNAFSKGKTYFFLLEKKIAYGLWNDHPKGRRRVINCHLELQNVITFKIH